MNAPAPAPRLRPFTPKELAAVLGIVTPDTVRIWCHDGKLPLVKKGPPYLIAPRVLEEMHFKISQLTTPT